ncbi:hypothetical protein GGI23_001747 [Coemansia sp. RSA 2559]|nr:hypothetical protein GGI23_001747 [Coemansia sp. RSA 2559]
MTVGRSYSSECVVGYLQKKGRFYSWKRALFVLCEQGLIQLSAEQQQQKKQRGHQNSVRPVRIPAQSQIIGDTSDVNLKRISTLKQKQCISLHQLCQMVGQGQREISITLLDSSTFVLRAQSSDDRDQWLAAIRSAIAAAAVAGYAAEYPDHDDAYSVTDEYPGYSNDAPPPPPADAATPSAVAPLTVDLTLPIGSVGDLLAQTDADAQAAPPTGIYTTQQGNNGASVVRDDNTMGWLPSTASLPRIDNEQDPSRFLEENTSNALSSHFAASLQHNDSHEFGQSISHIARDVGSIDVDALFADGNSEIGGSASSGALPLAVIATRTAELRRAKQAADTSLLSKESNMQLPALKSFVKPPEVTNVSGFDGMFDTLLYTQEAESPEDFAGTLFDGICLGNLSSADIEKTFKLPSSGQTSSMAPQPPTYQTTQTPDHAAQNSTPSQASSAVLEDPREENLASRLLNSPVRSKLDNHIRAAGRRSVMTIYGGLGVSAQQQKQKHLGPSGIQMSMLAKYSDSLNASRTLLSSGLRTNKGPAAHAWGSRADFTGGMHNAERPTSIVQYESKEPKDTGVRKVVRGQFAKELIQKEAERRPAVRRMRQVKSETKVPPLKSIRLRLDGSIVGSNTSKNVGLAAINSSPRDTANRGLQNTANNGKDNSASAKSGGTDAFEEFNAIRERLRVAEEQKMQQQQAQMLDNEGVDNVRIGDLMQTRQDVPLAIQIEEKRRMQEAKRLALLSQQLEHQKREMELQRLNAEQQQKFQEFKRQSLCPSVGGAAAQAGWTGYDNSAYGRADSYTHQWVQNQNPNSASMMPSSYAQSMYLQSQVASRPVSNAGFRPASYMGAAAAGGGGGGGGGYMHAYSATGVQYPESPAMAYDSAHPWQQQQQQHSYLQGNASGRPVSQYVQVGAQNPWPANGPTEHALTNSKSMSKRRQPGGAFIKHGRAASAGAKSERSKASTESWQSNIGRGARSSIHANTEPTYEGSVYVISPVPNSGNANGNPDLMKRRAHSYGQAEHRRRLMAKRVSDVLARPRATNSGNNVPPVPPLPQNIQQGGHYPQAQQYLYQQQQQQQQQQQYYVPYQMANGGLDAQNQMFMTNQQRMYTEMQTARKRNEMSTDTPSLLQQLEHARVLGALPTRHKEKAAYTRGAYQNYNTSQLIRGDTSSSMQYLGDGNTLLIDQAYEAEKSRSALLKKISHTYRGIGGESAPAPVF